MNQPIFTKARILIFAGLLVLAVIAGAAFANSFRPGSASAQFTPNSEASGTSNVRLEDAEFKGTVEQMDAASLTLSGITFRLDAQTIVQGTVQPGSFVEVKAVVLPDGTRYATLVKLDDSASASPEFKFYGTVQSIESGTWLVKDTTVVVNANTFTETGIIVGSFVEVEGTLSNGILTARKITLEDGPSGTTTPGTEVEFYGTVESISGNTWMIGGRKVVTVSTTEIKNNPQVGSYVKVHATPQADGSYLAREIEIDDDNRQGDDNRSGEIEFYGTVESINGSIWMIGGRTVTLAANAEVKDNPQVGSYVKVHATLQADGSYLAREIEVDMDDDMNDDNGGDDDNDDDWDDDDDDD